MLLIEIRSVVHAFNCRCSNLSAMFCCLRSPINEKWIHNHRESSKGLLPSHKTITREREGLKMLKLSRCHLWTIKIDFLLKTHSSGSFEDLWLPLSSFRLIVTFTSSPLSSRRIMSSSDESEISPSSSLTFSKSSDGRESWRIKWKLNLEKADSSFRLCQDFRLSQWMNVARRS